MVFSFLRQTRLARSSRLLWWISHPERGASATRCTPTSFSLHSRWFLFVYFLPRHHHCIISSISVTSPTQCNSFISHGSFQPRRALALESAPVLIAINLFQPTTAHYLMCVCVCAPPGTASITRRCPTRWTWAPLRSRSSQATTKPLRRLTQICSRCSAMQRWACAPAGREKNWGGLQQGSQTLARGPHLAHGVISLCWHSNTRALLGLVRPSNTAPVTPKAQIPGCSAILTLRERTFIKRCDYDCIGLLFLNVLLACGKKIIVEFSFFYL